MTDAVERGPTLVLIEGEPGIGKTRLLREALAAVPERTTLFAACPPLREPFTLGPVVGGLRRLWQQNGDIGLSVLGGALRPLFPEWADELPAALEPLDDPAETRHRLFRALTELVERLSVEVLVVEDAHWADAATLEWLLTLTSVANHGMSVVTTYRPTDVPEDSLLLRLTSRLPAGMSHIRVHLEPLDVAQTRQFIGSMFDADEVSEKFAAFLCERADGIPLAIEESIRLLRDRHDIVHHDGQWTRRLLDELEVPPTVRDSVLERVSRLPIEAQRVLEAAAVLAEPADEALLIAVAGLEGQQGEQGVAAALASGVLREASAGWFTFRHVLDAQAVGEAIPASQRRRLHGRAADALRIVEPEPVTRLARHFREAGDTKAWCHYAEASADLALESGDDRTAVIMLLDLMTGAEHPTERRVRIASKLGEAAVSGATPLSDLGPRVRRMLDEVISDASLEAEGRGQLRLLQGRLLSLIDEAGAASAEYEAAVLDLTEQPILAARAMLNLSWPLAGPHSADWHRGWLGRASQLAPQLESPEERMWFSFFRVIVLGMLGDDETWQAAAALPRSADNVRERQLIARGVLNMGQIAKQWGRYDDAERRLTEASSLVQASGLEREMDTVTLECSNEITTPEPGEGCVRSPSSWPSPSKRDQRPDLGRRCSKGCWRWQVGLESRPSTSYGRYWRNSCAVASSVTMALCRRLPRSTGCIWLRATRWKRWRLPGPSR